MGDNAQCGSVDFSQRRHGGLKVGMVELHGEVAQINAKGNARHHEEAKRDRKDACDNY